MRLPKPYYQDEFATIYQGDNRYILPAFFDDAGSRPFQLLLTDPPYGINVAARGSVGSGTKRAPSRKFAKSEWDKETAEFWTVQMAMALCRWQVIWGGNYYPLKPQAGWFVWDKLVNGDFADCELAWTNLPRACRKFTFMWNGMIQEDMQNKELREHECQKPVALMGWCLEQIRKVQAFDPEAVVLDPWMGSGPTLRACKDRGIKCVGIEGEIKHCETAARKLAQEVLITETVTEKDKANVDSEQVGLL